MNTDAAFEKFKDAAGAIDLTADNVQKVRDPKARRRFKSVLDKTLPRRLYGIDDSSYGRELRMKYLFNNCWFRDDIKQVRRILKIPVDGFSEKVAPHLEGKALKLLADPSITKARLITEYWLDLHRYNILKEESFIKQFNLPASFLNSAACIPDWHNKSVPKWLKQDPMIPGSYRPNFNLALPVDRCVAAIIGRYRLPWSSAKSILVFTVTGKTVYFNGRSGFDIRIESSEASSGLGFHVSVDWIDEFTTRKQWLDVFNQHIFPRQKLLWNDRGEPPHKKRLEYNELVKPWVFELVKLTRGRNKMAIEAALYELAIREDLHGVPSDRSTAYDVRNRLRRLMGVPGYE